MTSSLTYPASQAHLEDIRRWTTEHPRLDRPAPAVRRLFATLLAKPAKAPRTLAQSAA